MRNGKRADEGNQVNRAAGRMSLKTEDIGYVVRDGNHRLACIRHLAEWEGPLAYCGTIKKLSLYDTNWYNVVQQAIYLDK